MHSITRAGAQDVYVVMRVCVEPCMLEKTDCCGILGMLGIVLP